MGWLVIWFGILSTCGGIWLDGLGQNRETNEEHDEDCVEEGFQSTRAKLNRNGNGGKKAINMGNCSISISDGSELELA